MYVINKSVKLQKGFTLIELMIVIGIIGVLFALAVPIYREYISRTQVTRVVYELSAAKTGVDGALFEGRIPVVTLKAQDESKFSGVGLSTGYNSNNRSAADYEVRSNILKKIEVLGFNEGHGGSKGQIVGTLGRQANRDVHDALVIQERSDKGVWECWIKPNGRPSWRGKFIPPNCKVGSGTLTP